MTLNNRWSHCPRIYHLNSHTGFFSDLWPLTHLQVSNDCQYLEASGQVQRTPLRGVHCGGITVQHFIISLLSGCTELNSGHTSGGTGSGQRKQTEEREASICELQGGGEGGFKQRDEVWIKEIKKKRTSQNNGLIPTYETNKKQTDQTEDTTEKRKIKTRQPKTNPSSVHDL